MPTFPETRQYIGAMTAAQVTRFVATTYVRDLDRSRAFYQAVGFAEQSVGRNELSAWLLLRQGGTSVLLATSQPPIEIPPLPLLFYFFVDDLAAAVGSLTAAGYPTEHVGYPPHALGGEARTADPDGNTVLLGQAVRSASQVDLPESNPSEHFSLLREAAALAQHRAGASGVCQVGNAHGEPCRRPAEVKLADPWGDSTWACIPHAEEALIHAPGAFIANQDQQGLGPFLAHRRR